MSQHQEPELHAPHLSKEPCPRPTGRYPPNQLPAGGENEAYCGDCGRRVTVSPPEDEDDEWFEYGHDDGCPHRIAWRKVRGIK